MAKHRQNGIDMTNGPLFRKVLLFSLPLTATGMLQVLFNAADSIVVGKFAGANCLAAVGATTQFSGLLVSLFLGISTGVNIVVARYLGAQDQDKVERSVHCAMALSVVMGLLLTAAGLLLTKPVLRAMGTPEDIIDLSVLYLKIYFLAAPAEMVYNFGAAILSANGDTRKPLGILMLAGVVNVILNVLTVAGFHWDVVGVAAATDVSLYASAALMVICLRKYDNSCRLVLRKLNLNPKYAFELVRVGLPTGLQYALINISNVMTQSAMNTFGSVALAGDAAALSLDCFAYTSITCGIQASVSFASQNYGAKKYERVRKVLWNTVAVVSIIGLPICIGIWLASPELLRLYLDAADPNLQTMIDTGMSRLTYSSTMYVFYGIMNCFAGCLRGIGHQVLPMLVSMVGLCGFRILWLQVVFQKGNLMSLYLLYPASWIFTLVVQSVCFAVKYRKLLRSTQEVQQ